jgi:GNAT superfamily N-acetyltransferase
MHIGYPNNGSSSERFPALLGISRIWTSPKHRRQGIASRLVACAAENFVYGMKLSEGQIAFSQPTDSGAYFALNWASKRNERNNKAASQAGYFLIYMDSV